MLISLRFRPSVWHTWTEQSSLFPTSPAPYLSYLSASNIGHVHYIATEYSYLMDGKSRPCSDPCPGSGIQEPALALALGLCQHLLSSLSAGPAIRLQRPIPDMIAAAM